MKNVKKYLPNAISIMDKIIPDEMRIIENPLFTEFTDISGNNTFN